MSAKQRPKSRQRAPVGRRNSTQRVRISLTTTAQVHEYLNELVDKGLYGNTISEAAERLVCEGLLKRTKK